MKRTETRAGGDAPITVALTSNQYMAATLAVPAAGIDLAALERALIGFALASSGGNRTRAARFLGLSRSALLYRMHKHGLAGGALRDGPR